MIRVTVSVSTAARSFSLSKRSRLRDLEFLIVSAYDSLLKDTSELRVNRVNDVAVRAIGILAARHNDEEFVSGIDNLDVMHCESLTVKGYRNR